MPSLNLINSNPFIEHYRAGVAAADAEASRDQQMKAQQQNYDITAEQRPYKLRDVVAATGTNESNARVANATEGFKIGEAGSRARGAETTANRAQFDFGEEQANAPAKRRQIEAQTGKSEFDLEQDKINAPIETRRKSAEATGAEARARFDMNRRNYDVFDKAMEALKAGRPDMAQVYAQQGGQTIPQAMLDNAQLRDSMLNLWANAKNIYPNSPEKQLQYLQTALKAMTDSAGKVNYNPAQAVNVPGMPEAPERTPGLLTGAGARSPAGGGAMSVEDSRLLIRLEAANKHPDPTNPFAPASLDTKAIGAQLHQMGRDDLARLYDPTLAPAPAAQPQPGASAQPGAPAAPVNFPGAETTSSVPIPLPARTAPAAASPTPGAQPTAADPNLAAQGYRQAPDGKWYRPDPSRPGKYLMRQ